MLQRRMRNKVVKLKDGNDVWIDSPGEVRNLVEEYFANLFTSSGLRIGVLYWIVYTPW